MQVSLLAKGDLGVKIPIKKIAEIVSEETPVVLDERDIDLKIFTAPFSIKRISPVSIHEIDASTLGMHMDIQVSSFKSLLLTDFKLDAKLRIRLKLSLASNTEWFTILYDRYEWISPIRLKPVNLSRMVTNIAEKKIEELLPSVLLNVNKQINEDINNKIKEELIKVSNTLKSSEINRHIHIECEEINRRIKNEHLLLTLNSIYVETTDGQKNSLNSYELENQDKDLDESYPFSIIAEIDQDVLIEQVGIIELPSHEYILNDLVHSKKYLRMHFINTKGIVGDFTIFMDIYLDQGAIIVKPKKIKFEKKIIKFISNFNWSQDLLLEIIEKKIMSIIDSSLDKAIDEMPLENAKLLNLVNFEELKVHSEDGSVEALVKFSIDAIDPVQLNLLS